MSLPTNPSVSEGRRIPAWLFALRLILVVVQLLFVYWLGETGTLFFYQGF